MQTPLTLGQKVIAYSSLVFILFWVLFGLNAIWLLMFADN